MSRKETPDILGALMGGAIKPESQLAVEQESVQAIKPVSNKGIKQAHFDGMRPPVEDQTDQAIPKEKATFNLSKAILSNLEDVWIEIRKKRGDKKISKTDIVEQAVEDAIKDFRFKGNLSKFYGNLARDKAIKK